MIYNSFSIAYAVRASEGSTSYGNYVDATTEVISVDIIDGQIPNRPLKGATGVFSNNEVYRINLQLIKGTDATLDALVLGDYVKIKTDDNIKVVEQEYVVCGKSFGYANGDEIIEAISLTPANVALDGSTPKVVQNLHA